MRKTIMLLRSYKLHRVISDEKVKHPLTNVRRHYFDVNVIAVIELALRVTDGSRFPQHIPLLSYVLKKRA